MRTDHPDRSFTLRWECCVARYSCDGALQDALHTKSVSSGKRMRRNVKRYGKTWRWLVEQGKQEIDLLNRGVLKRKL